MRKRQRLSIAGLLICLLGLYPLLAPPAHRIDQDHFELIQNGMTLGEVESIFGQPAGNYDGAVAEGVNALFVDLVVANFTPDGRRLLPSGTLSVDFDGDGFLDLHAQSQGGLRTVVWSDLTGSSRAAKTWTSRHGTCTISFDQHGRVCGNAGWGESRVVPPWQTWWKKLVGE